MFLIIGRCFPVSLFAEADHLLFCTLCAPARVLVGACADKVCGAAMIP